ncbi:kinetochore protein SPC24-like [Citrus sinensis]|uniref:Kinetochore protein SPC24-like n=1 Tax=Citrus sinensis TaxID=2711 RepID=A0ACB8JW10_CITSI|nr:kinetochore protein SPC24-like [Citrus sinensis]
MGESSTKIDVDKLISYSDDLVEVLKDRRDIDSLTRCLSQSESLESSCDADFNETLNAIRDYQERIDACKQKTERAKSDIAGEAEVDHLQIELEEELKKELIANEINDLERERVAIEEQKQTLKKFKQDELKAEMKLSMYASVTNIIPNLDDQSKIAGYIVDRDKKVIDKFEYDPAKMAASDICHNIWKAINL